MTEQVEAVLKQIQDKLTLLTKKNKALLKENQSLKDTLQEAQTAAIQVAKQAETLQNQLDSRKYVQGMLDPAEKKSFEKKIHKYIKEIDHCIALLSD